VDDEASHGVHAGSAALSSSDLVDKIYRNIVETNGKQHGWQVCFCSFFLATTSSQVRKV
jgi:hypothetical protein